MKSIQCGWNALGFPDRIEESELVMRSGSAMRVERVDMPKLITLTAIAGPMQVGTTFFGARRIHLESTCVLH